MQQEFMQSCNYSCNYSNYSCNSCNYCNYCNYCNSCNYSSLKHTSYHLHPDTRLVPSNTPLATRTH